MTTDLGDAEQDTLVLGDDPESGDVTVLEPGGRSLKVARIREAVGADWTEVGQPEVSIEHFGDVATRGGVDGNAEAHPKLQKHAEH